MYVSSLMSKMNKIIAKDELSAIAWNLVVEALSDMKQVDTALLEDFLCKAPLGYDSLPTNAKERLSLKRLEDLFATATNGNSTSLTSFSDCSILDASEQAQDVYHRLVHKMETSSLKAVTLDSLKVGVSDFILEKRACLPKCALQQLEEAFIEGGHPPSTFLRGVIGSNKEHQVEVARKLDLTANGITIQTPKEMSTHVISENLNKLSQDSHAKLSNSSRKRERKVRFVDGGTTTAHVNNEPNCSTENIKIGEFHSLDETTSTLIPENVIENMQNVTPDNVVFDTRNKSESTGKERAACSDGGEPNPMEYSSDSPRTCQPSESCRGSVLSSIQHEATDLANKTRLLHERMNCVDDVGDGEHVVSKRIKRRANGGQMDSDMPQCFHNNDNIPQKEPLEGFQGKNYVNDAKSDGGDKTKPSSCGSEEHQNIAPAFGFNLDTTVSAMKNSLLSSDITLSEDSLDADWTEKESCIVCNRGQPLICCVNTCQVAVHESCLGFSPVLDDTGNFYCPSCSYSQAVATYREIKQKMIKAKEMAELAKDRLYKFMKLGHGSKRKQAYELPSLEESDQSEMVGNKNFLDELNAKGKQNDIADNRVTLSGPCQREAEFEVSSNEKQKERANNQAVLSCACPREGEHPPISSNILHSCPSEIRDKDLASITKETQQKQANNHVGGNILENHEALESSFELPSVDDQQHTDLETEDRGMRQQSVSSTIGPSPVFDGNDNAVAVNADKQQKVVSSPGRNSIRSDENTKEVSEYDIGNGSHDLRRRQIPVKRSNQGLPFRRKKIPWAPEEEEKLKEGVQKYANSNAAWKRILEFGQGVFQESRTAIDLKDKWRNMCTKGRPKGKKKVQEVI